MAIQCGEHMYTKHYIFMMALTSYRRLNHKWQMSPAPSHNSNMQHKHLRGLANWRGTLYGSSCWHEPHHVLSLLPVWLSGQRRRGWNDGYGHHGKFLEQTREGQWGGTHGWEYEKRWKFRAGKNMVFYHHFLLMFTVVDWNLGIYASQQLMVHNVQS